MPTTTISPSWAAFCRACLSHADRLQATRRHVTATHGLAAWLEAGRLGSTPRQRQEAAAQLRRIRGGQPLHAIRRQLAAE